MGEVSTEPSMEEILSSIKRIIAEDSEAALAPPRARRAAAAAHAVADPVPEATAAEDEAEVLELTETVAPEVVETAPVVKLQPIVADVAKPTLVSPAAAEASRSSLAALSALVVKPEITGGDTLEGLVREMIKPMIADWLEAKLPEIVERLVAREISRITDRG